MARRDFLPDHVANIVSIFLVSLPSLCFFCHCHLILHCPWVSSVPSLGELLCVPGWWASPLGESAPRGHGAVSGNICSRHSWGTPGITWAGAGAAAPSLPPAPAQCPGQSCVGRSGGGSPEEGNGFQTCPQTSITGGPWQRCRSGSPTPQPECRSHPALGKSVPNVYGAEMETVFSAIGPSGQREAQPVP